MAVDSGDEPGAADPDRGEWTIRDAAARRYVRRAVTATVSLVESTYGPDGSEKLVRTVDPQNRPETVRTDDGGRLFEAVERGDGFTHPVAALFVDGVDGMAEGLSDGTTAAVLLAGGLLEEGFDLLERGLAPSSVVVGYGIARSRAGTALDELARSVDVGDRDRLADVAATAMTSLDGRDRLADVAATAMTSLDGRDRLADDVATTVTALAGERADGWVDTDDARVLAAPAATPGVYEGLVLSRPDDADPNGSGVREPIGDAGVAVLDRAVDPEETASVLDGGDGVRLSSTAAAREYREGLERRLRTAAERLREVGVDVLVCTERLDESTVRPFETAGLAVVDKATYPERNAYRLARATGGTVVPDVDEVTPDRVGRAGRVSERRIGDEVWTVFEDCPGPVRTLVASAETRGGAARRENAAVDALEATATALMDGQVLPGAGAPAAAVAAAVRSSATEVSGREQLAVDAFADAVERVPAALSRNAGHDPVETVAALRTEHASGRGSAGVDPATGEPTDAWAAGVVEPRRVFSQAIETAAAVAERLLTVDAVLYPGVDLPGYTPRPER